MAFRRALNFARRLCSFVLEDDAAVPLGDADILQILRTAYVAFEDEHKCANIKPISVVCIRVTWRLASSKPAGKGYHVCNYAPDVHATHTHTHTDLA